MDSYYKTNLYILHKAVAICGIFSEEATAIIIIVYSNLFNELQTNYYDIAIYVHG